MDTQLSIALKRAEDLEVIPKMIHPLSKYWKQPNRKLIQIDANYALMSKEVFEQLADYSCSVPSGVYEGKMWRCEVGAYDPRVKLEDRYWILRWWGKSEDPDKCSCESRKILII